jgi:hypothetical protein
MVRAVVAGPLAVASAHPHPYGDDSFHPSGDGPAGGARGSERIVVGPEEACQRGWFGSAKAGGRRGSAAEKSLRAAGLHAALQGRRRDLAAGSPGSRGQRREKGPSPAFGEHRSGSEGRPARWLPGSAAVDAQSYLVAHGSVVMLKSSWMDDGLGPLKGFGVLVPGGRKAANGLAYLPRTGGVQAPKHSSGEDAEPDLNLVQSGSVGRGVMV